MINAASKVARGSAYHPNENSSLIPCRVNYEDFKINITVLRLKLYSRYCTELCSEFAVPLLATYCQGNTATIM